MEANGEEKIEVTVQSMSLMMQTAYTAGFNDGIKQMAAELTGFKPNLEEFAKRLQNGFKNS